MFIYKGKDGLLMVGEIGLTWNAFLFIFLLGLLKFISIDTYLLLYLHFIYLARFSNNHLCEKSPFQALGQYRSV